MYKEIFRITIGMYILILLLTGIGMAIPPPPPPPPVPQSIGLYDTNIGSLPISICNACHNPIPTPISTIPHHNTTYAQNRDCVHCHGAFIDNSNDGHLTKATSMMSTVCSNCHDRDLSKTPPILKNNETHHDAIRGVTQGFDCTYCHNSSGNSFPMNECEQCHSVYSLHNIQASYGYGVPGLGHLNTNWDCQGCHVDINHYGGDCKACHPYPITTPIPFPRGKISGMKFNDSNGNGIRDPGESGLSGIRIVLRRIISPGNEINNGSVLTDINGNYTFTNLNVSWYKVREVGVFGMSQTFPANGAPQYVNTNNEEKTGIDFGNQQVSPGRIIGKKFNDTNGNGLQDIGENGISGINITLSPSGIIRTTNSTGDYIFDNVPVGEQLVYEQLMPGYGQTTPGFVYVNVKSSETSVVNFGNKQLTTLPLDVSILQQSANQNGVPIVYRPGLVNTGLTIQKDLSSMDISSVSLTLAWNDGTTKTANMVNTTGIWQTTFSQPFPRGVAQMTFNVDVNPPGSGSEDFIELGNIIFLDPSGQIRSACNNKAIGGAEAKLYVEFPPTSGNFIISPPENQLESNPQITSEDGFYGWMTQPGKYKVKVTKAGYNPNESNPVIVPPPETGIDILLTSTNGCPYNFIGFFPPIDNLPTWNSVKAGSAIPVKFSLYGDQSLDIFATGYPASQKIDCNSNVLIDLINETVTTGSSGLSYNATTDQYNYVWKTDKIWANSCRQLTVKLKDNTYHNASFKFLK